jgi:cytochrome c-type biogenesis protein CcmF
VLAVLGLGLAAFTAMGALIEWADRLKLFRIPLRDSLRRAINLPRSAYGMMLAHLGLAISAAGIAAAAFSVERIEVVKLGGTLEISGYTMHLSKVDEIPGPNYVAQDATIDITHNGALVWIAHPQRRFFTVQQQTTSLTAIRSSVFADLYVAIGESDGQGGWTIRAYHKPLISWIWLGALIMAGGGIASLSDRRWRVGAASRSRSAAAAQPAA